MSSTKHTAEYITRHTPAMLQCAREKLAQPASGASLSKYLAWFAKQAKVPAARAESHPQFWDSKLLSAFISMHHMQRDMQASVQQMAAPGMADPAAKANVLQQLAASGLTGDMNDLFDMGDSSSDDDDMPEPGTM